MPSATAAPSPGSLIADRYEVLRPLGSGKGGQVFLVRDTHLGDEVALKLLNPVAGAPATWHEAQTLRQLSSPYLLPVINADVASPGDLRYITTPHMTGGDLALRAQGRGVAVAAAVSWATQLSHGLHRMHSVGLLHRDVKPGNVYIAGNQDALLGDLGGAITMDPDGSAPAFGTPQTVAPEVINTQRCAVPSDVYSLAATAFYLLCGKYPVNARGGTVTVLKRIVTGDQRRLRDVAPHVPLAISSIVERALSHEPTQRPSSALDFANRISSAQRGQRDWEPLDHDASHRFCVSGSPRKPKQKGVTVCAVPIGVRWRVVVVLDGGRHVRKHETVDVTFEQLPVLLREVCSKV